MKIINIRGTNGAGKTTLVRELMKRAGECVDIHIGAADVPGHYLRALNTVVVGPYPDGKATGGMDNVQTTALAQLAVSAAADGLWDNREHDRPRAVIFEGILISTVFETWRAFSASRKLAGLEPLTWAYLLTPEDECVARVKQRRAAKGRPEEGFKEILVRDKFKSIARTRVKAKEAGETVVDLLPGTELNQLLEIIG